MFDFENGVWTKPSAHTKQRKLHRVPLSGPAVQLLVEMKAAAKAKPEAEGTPPSPYVFPGPTGKPLTETKRTWVTVCRRAGLGAEVPGWTRKGILARVRR